MPTVPRVGVDRRVLVAVLRAGEAGQLRRPRRNSEVRLQDALRHQLALVELCGVFISIRRLPLF